MIFMTDNRYRGDKKRFFITAQVVVSLRGIIYNVTLGLGHNNDQGMFDSTGVREVLEQHNLNWLADSGYHHNRLVCPRRESRQWDEMQASLRSIIEVVFSHVHSYKFSSGKVRQSPELQSIGLMIIYNLVNWDLTTHPIRPQYQ